MHETPYERDLKVVEKHARDLGARIYWNVPLSATGAEGPRAQSSTKEIWSTPLNAGTPAQRSGSFWATMHELGHVALKHIGADPFTKMLLGPEPSEPEQEAEAWVWGIDHAERPLDEAGRADVQFALASYLHSQRGTPFVGPALSQLVRALGPEVNEELFVELFPEAQKRVDGEQIYVLAGRAWTDFALWVLGDIKSAA